MNTEKKQSFMQGIITLMFSQVIIKIMGLIYKLYLTNKQGFGDTGNAIYNGGFQIYALLLTISSIGVPNAMSKMISERLSIGDRRGADKIFRVAFASFSIVGFIGSCILFFGAKTIAKTWIQIPEAELSLIVLAPSVFLVSLISVLRGYFNGNENMKPMARSQALEQMFKTLFTIILVEIVCLTMGSKNTTKYMAAAANLSTTMATFICFLYLVNLYLKSYKVRSRTAMTGKTLRTKEIIKNIIIIAMPLTISAILGSLNKNIDSMTIVRCLKNFMTDEQAKIQYGILSGKIDTLVMLPLSFNIAFATALVPAISAGKARGDMQSIKKRISFSLLITILIGVPCTIGMFTFAKPILEMLFPNASNGEALFKISSIAIIFITIEQTINGALQGLGKLSIPVISLGIGAVIKLILNLVLIRIPSEKFIFGGINGAAFATIVCHVVSSIISFVALKKNINIKFKISKYIFKPVFASITMAFIGWNIYNFAKCIIIQNIAIILAILIAIIVYVILVLALRIFDIEEIYMLPFGAKILRKLKIIRA